MLAMVGSPIAAFLSNKHITIYIWPCMTGAHSWPRVLLTSQPTLQTHWARVAVVFFIWENVVWWKAGPGDHTSVLVCLWHQFEFQMQKRIVSGALTAHCLLTDTHSVSSRQTLGPLSGATLCQPLSCFLSFPPIPTQGPQLRCGVCGACASRCLSRESWWPRVFLPLPLGRQC